MARCPACREYIEGDRERIGARCPYCRLPLYERPEIFRPPPPSTDNRCTIHPENPALAACQRCGNFQCDVCRSRWRDRSLCVACVNRILEANETAPEEARAHLLQSVLALVLGLISWGLTVVFFILVAVAVRDGLPESPDQANNSPEGQRALMLMGIGGILLLASPLPALLGVGQGASALRTRGNHMILATLGLLVSGLHVGALIGLFSFAVWQMG